MGSCKPTITMTLLQLLSDMANAVEVGDIEHFIRLQEKASDLLVTSEERQQVDSIIEVLEAAITPPGMKRLK